MKKKTVKKKRYKQSNVVVVQKYLYPNNDLSRSLVDAARRVNDFAVLRDTAQDFNCELCRWINDPSSINEKSLFYWWEMFERSLTALGISSPLPDDYVRLINELKK